MTVQSGLVPLLDEETGRFPDEFAPPSVAADAVAARDAAEAAGRAQDAAEAAENSAAEHEREAGQIVEDATATIPGLIGEQVTAQIDPKVAAATQAKTDAETAQGAAQTARDDALQAKAQAVAAQEAAAGSAGAAATSAGAAAADAERAEQAAQAATAPTDEMVAGLLGTAGTQARTAMEAGLALAHIDPPDGFPTDCPIPLEIYRTGLGRYVIDIDVAALRPPAGATYYIAPNGLPANGGTESAPTTLPTALAKSDVGTIICLPGEYFRNTHTAPFINKSVNIIGRPGAILTNFTDPAVLAWSLESGNVYKCTRPATLGVVDKRGKYLDAHGDYPLYTRKASLAELSQPGQWATDNSTVWVWPLDNADLAADASFLRLGLNTSTGTLSVKGSNTLYVEGLQIEGGGDRDRAALLAFVDAGESSRPRLVAVDTTVKYSVTTGARVSGGLLGIFVRCVSASTGGDGFSASVLTRDGIKLVPWVIEVDCLTRLNGQSTNTYQNDNGSTSHEGSKVIRVNGVYRGSYGPTVGEDGGAKSWNLGVQAGSSRAPDRAWAYCASADGSAQWLEDCSADPGQVALYAFPGSKIYSRRGRTGSLLSMSKTGPVEQY